MILVRPAFGLAMLVYVVIGVAVASAHDYFQSADAVERIVSAVLAVFFWPLVLAGVDLQIET